MNEEIKHVEGLKLYSGYSNSDIVTKSVKSLIDILSKESFYINKVYYINSCISAYSFYHNFVFEFNDDISKFKKLVSYITENNDFDFNKIIYYDDVSNSVSDTEKTLIYENKNKHKKDFNENLNEKLSNIRRIVILEN